MKKNLSKRERLKKKADFNHVFSKNFTSKNVSLYGISLYVGENGMPFNRIGIVVTKRFGKAVRRNRVKRHIREIYRNMKHTLKSGYDVVVVIYPGECSYEKRREQMGSLFRKADLFCSPAC